MVWSPGTQGRHAGQKRLIPPHDMQGSRQAQHSLLDYFPQQIIALITPMANRAPASPQHSPSPEAHSLPPPICSESPPTSIQIILDKSPVEVFGTPQSRSARSNNTINLSAPLPPNQVIEAASPDSSRNDSLSFLQLSFIFPDQQLNLAGSSPSKSFSSNPSSINLNCTSNNEASSSRSIQSVKIATRFQAACKRSSGNIQRAESKSGELNALISTSFQVPNSALLTTPIHEFKPYDIQCEGSQQPQKNGET